LHAALANRDAALGDMAQTRTELQKALDLKPSDAHTLYQIAVIYEQRFGQRDKALQYLRKSIEQGQTSRDRSCPDACGASEGSAISAVAARSVT
jgi:tetratricopeptide (TPR) repeat protein